jgi:protein-S-isoprenylcysteine O-methyltransferase Ste14
MIEILLGLTALNLAVSIPMALAVKRDFTSLGRVSFPVAIWTGAAMHGHALVTFLLAWHDRGSLPFGPSWTIIGGWLLIVAGAAIIVAGRAAYASVKRVYGMKEDKLIEHGVYRWSRNPQYFGYWIMFIGAAIAGASVWTLVLAILFAVFVHLYIVLVEEPHLSIIFPDAYRAYCDRVSRYWGIPSSPGNLPSIGV